MAENLLSLKTSGTVKHVVPWKNRSDFLTVYQDLYSSDVSAQKAAISRIDAWKSRAGNKLSVAIESSATLALAQLTHQAAVADGKMKQGEYQLRLGYSLALIRFVNHITEKSQTKAMAQPVHLIAREFGIPEWIVRLRHDATHNNLPCLEVLTTGVEWALGYLRENFWEQQNAHREDEEEEEVGAFGGGGRLVGGPIAGVKEEDDTGNDGGDDGGGGTCGADTKGVLQDNSPKSADIQRELSRFQEIRTQQTLSKGEEEEAAKVDHSAVLSKLQQLLLLDRVRFLECLLEDGNLIATKEQLKAFGVEYYDLTEELPPSIPLPMALFWRPLLKRVSNVGSLPLLLQTALQSLRSEVNLRDYQLVAWVAFILANTQISASSGRSKKRRLKGPECFMRTPHPLPTRTLFLACTGNLNQLTVYLLRYLSSPVNAGEERHRKLSCLLNFPASSSVSNKGQTTLTTADTPAAAASSQSEDTSALSSDAESESEGNDEKTFCLAAKKDAPSYPSIEGSGFVSPTTVEEVRKVLQTDTGISWNLTPDIVEWSSVPIGLLPRDVALGDTTRDGSDGGCVPGTEGGGSRHHRRRHGRDDDDDSDDSDDADLDANPKRSKLIVTEGLLI